MVRMDVGSTSSKGCPLSLTEKIFSKGLTREKPISIIGKRKGKRNANADSNRKKVQSIPWQ
jgi:hypothetical protein